ncbi:MAG: hypothetical protein C0621_09590 [Desulfuromonas sp.]|nr:MAG: hypothetical protein C0621_09590 [Desulfuromonas sp.]
MTATASPLATETVSWFNFGLKVIPVARGGKKPVTKWDPWLADLSESSIREHWQSNPSHEVGFIVGDDLIVFDADTQEAVDALRRIETEYETLPNLVVSTTKGEHHYFRRPANVFAMSTGHGEGPEQKIDIKTGRTMVVLPPSTGKDIAVKDVSHVSELIPVTQGFVDSVYLMIGKKPPLPPQAPPAPAKLSGDESLEKVKTLLDHINPDSNYKDWLNVLMAIFHESAGSNEGLDLADAWSRGGKKYKGRDEIEEKWKTFDPDHPNPVTIATLCRMIDDQGGDSMDILAGEPFAVLDEETEVVTLTSPISGDNPLLKFSLKGKSDELMRNAQEETPLLGKIALRGQATLFYARYNVGKTLILLRLLADAITEGIVDPNHVYYLNLDDSSKGLALKTQMAEEFGFHILADGFSGFSASETLPLIRQITEGDSAREHVIIIDTTEKIVNLGDKSDCRNFTIPVRNFIQKGGTLILLAHVTKYDDPEGNPIHSGTSDLPDDLDCAYLLKVADQIGEEKLIKFTNKKKRGDVPATAYYAYSDAPVISYRDLFDSVRFIDESELNNIRQSKQMQKDSSYIEAVKDCIREGTVKKMELVKGLASQTGLSNNKSTALIDRYIDKHWNVQVKAHNTKEFSLIE